MQSNHSLTHPEDHMLSQPSPSTPPPPTNSSPKASPTKTNPTVASSTPSPWGPIRIGLASKKISNQLIQTSIVKSCVFLTLMREEPSAQFHCRKVPEKGD